MRPGAESQGANLSVKWPQMKIQLTKADELRGRHPQHSAVVINDAGRIAVMFDRTGSSARRKGQKGCLKRSRLKSHLRSLKNHQECAGYYLPVIQQDVRQPYLVIPDVNVWDITILGGVPLQFVIHP